MTKKAEPGDESGAFLKVLEKGVKDVLGNKDSLPGERIAAVTAGAKLLMIKHRISGDDQKGFFD